MFTTKINEDRVLSINECIEIFNHVDLNNKEDVMKNAWALKALANDKMLLHNQILTEIEKGIENFQNNNVYTPQSLILGHGNGFYIRANIWEPQEIEDINDEDVNIYELCHDHNFNFLTVGYYGPGYKTEMYDYDYESVEGNSGEKVEMNYRGSFELAEGEVFYYERSKHIHSQIPPKSLSISLNLMASHKEQSLINQYVFDPQKQVIVENISPGYKAQSFLMNLAGELGNEDSQPILKDLSERFPNRHARNAASNALQNLEKRAVNE